MPYRKDIFAQGQYYHIYNRTIPGVPLFFNPGNYLYFLRLVQRSREPYGANVIAYCLMPNHYHFLLRQETDVPLSRFVAAVLNAYVQALNRQQGRRGPLFQGRFRHAWVDREEYITHLCRYIHLNPVQANLVAVPEAWQYSNYIDWIGLRTGTLKDEEFIHEHFQTPDEYRRFVEAYRSETPDLLAPYIWD
jgi:REP element-mobilizing transposase RayT